MACFFTVLFSHFTYNTCGFERKCNFFNTADAKCQLNELKKKMMLFEMLLIIKRDQSKCFNWSITEHCNVLNNFSVLF